MAMPDILAFDPYRDPSTRSKRWEVWRRRFENDMAEFGIASPKRQRALLHYYGGEDLVDVLDTLDDTGERDEIKPALDALSRYFTPPAVGVEMSKLTAITAKRGKIVDDDPGQVRETIDKNSHQRDTSDENSHQSETVDKNSYKRDTSDKNTHQRETLSVANSHQERGENHDKSTYQRETIS